MDPWPRKSSEPRAATLERPDDTLTLVKHIEITEQRQPNDLALTFFCAYYNQTKSLMAAHPELKKAAQFVYDYLAQVCQEADLHSADYDLAALGVLSVFAHPHERIDSSLYSYSLQYHMPLVGALNALVPTIPAPTVGITRTSLKQTLRAFTGQIFPEEAKKRIPRPIVLNWIDDRLYQNNPEAMACLRHFSAVAWAKR